MPYVTVPKDLTKVKTKVAFNLTRRQILCFGGGGLIGIPFYFLARGSIGNDAAALLMIVLMLPFFMFGIFEKDGQPLEKYLGYYLRWWFIYPQTRPYQTDNIYAALERQNREEEMRLETQAAKARGKTAKSKARLASGARRAEKKHPFNTRR